MESSIVTTLNRIATIVDTDWLLRTLARLAKRLEAAHTDAERVAAVTEAEEEVLAHGFAVSAE